MKKLFIGLSKSSFQPFYFHINTFIYIHTMCWESDVFGLMQQGANS